MAGAWIAFDCAGAKQRWRYLDSGAIEIEGGGSPEDDWPAAVNDWRSLIETAAAKHGVAPAWIAATMAMETGGRNLCLSAADPSKICGPPCICVQNEGAGVMAMLPSTASTLAGRSVSSQELMDDPELAIDLGTRLIQHNLERYGGDYVKAAVAYNAGSVKCGRGRVFVPAGADWPRERCPDTGWGVVMGCVYTDQKYGSRCAPSQTGVKAYVCSGDYPRRAIAMQNAARHHFALGPGPAPTPRSGARGKLTGFALGAALGYALLMWYDDAQ